MLLYAGSDCFSVLTYYLIAAVGSRNPAGALSTSAFAIAAGWLGIGCGALLVQSIEESCENVIRRFGLTPREGDVLRLLARGRTSPVIQEKLFLSHNTVKTHVRHIYAKMDIHSQQELIDIVEGADA